MPRPRRVTTTQKGRTISEQQATTTFHVMLVATASGPITNEMVGHLQNLFNGVLTHRAGSISVSGTVRSVHAGSAADAKADAENQLLAILASGSQIVSSKVVTL